jgi:hypothetical protein
VKIILASMLRTSPSRISKGLNIYVETRGCDLL